MKWLPGPGRGRRARKQWEAGLVWLRLRYQEPAGPTRCLKLLSRPAACGRIALYYLPGIVSQLYLGIPEVYLPLLQQMAGDFAFSMRPMAPGISAPGIQRLSPVSDLSWDQPFMCHIVKENLFVAPLTDARRRGTYLPEPSQNSLRQNSRPPEWQLPPTPPPGLTAIPSWNGGAPPEVLMAAAPDPGQWLLGRSRTGHLLQASGKINIYGGHEAAAAWLVHQVAQTVRVNPANLVVIDGAGDLVPRLKRKSTVTRLLGEQLAYIDIDAAAMSGGFNPLAAVPGETETALIERWQRWFRGMNVHPKGVALLVQARCEGVEDIPALRKWLKKVERGGQYVAASSLGLALNRLTASPGLREWLEWPATRFDILPAGALLFACKSSGWDRQQLLRGVLLAALSVPGARLIIHGFPWKTLQNGELNDREQMVISNGPLLTRNTTVLVKSSASQAARLSDRFLDGDARLDENLRLLASGEGIVLVEGEAVFSSWRASGKMDQSANSTLQDSDRDV